MRRDLTELNDDEKRLTAEVTGLVLERIAPEELVFLDETARDYFTDPQSVLNPAGGDEPLGFGVDFALITPYLLAVAGPVVKDAATAELSDRVRSVFRKKTAAPAEEQFAVTPDQARTIRELAARRALALGVPDDQARILADGFVANLMTRS